MRLAFWSNHGRGVFCAVAAVGIASAVGGCSSGISRFDMPSFNLTDSGASETADMTTTSSLPVPAESIYSPGRYRFYGDPKQSGGQVSRSSLQAPQSNKSQAYTAQRAPSAPPVTQARASGPRVKVQSGDTLSSLSQRYGVPIGTIQSANNLADARLRVGQELVMPGANAQVASVAPAASQPRAASPTLRPGETVYTVQSGDTPNTIAGKLGVDERSLMVRNDVRADALQIGQKLVIPAASAPSFAQAKTKPGVRTVKTTTIAAPGASAKKAPIPSSPEITGGSKPTKVASGGRLPSPDPMAGGSFRWPVKGRILSGFGTKPDGGHNDGVNISVPQGTPVKAAENGVVAYAGSELKGYGNLVLVRHANNWVSAYANNERLLVKRGDKVQRGQVIAKAGTTGSVSQPQVHFELRKGSRPVDPTKYMSSMSASAN